MQERGARPNGIEIGNAWKLHGTGEPSNWIVGETSRIPHSSLRFIKQSNEEGEGNLAANLCVKWFKHSPGDPAEWGTAKSTSIGRTFSTLVSEGEFELSFGVGPVLYIVILDEPGDFVIWGPGHAHTWYPRKESTILTLRWVPLNA